MGGESCCGTQNPAELEQVFRREFEEQSVINEETYHEDETREVMKFDQSEIEELKFKYLISECEQGEDESTGHCSNQSTRLESVLVSDVISTVVPVMIPSS